MDGILSYAGLQRFVPLDHIDSSLLVARVKFEPESSSSHESSSSQVKKMFFLSLILSSFNCDYCFHNVAPTAAQNINSPRYVTYVLITACKLFREGTFFSWGGGRAGEFWYFFAKKCWPSLAF